MLERFEQETKRDSGNEFVECLVYSEESGVIMTGNQTDDAESDKVNISFSFKVGAVSRLHVV